MKVAASIFLVLALITGVVVGVYFIKYNTADIRGRIEANEQLNSAEFRIAAYEHFFNLCASVETLEDSLVSQESLLDNAETVKERTRVRSNIAGMEGQRARAINQYNVDVDKGYTLAQFMDNDLPFKLNIESETNCA